jgi:hypothetical protein
MKVATVPFLLLVFAWCCANGTQTHSFNVTVWAKGARHFSHQQQLKAEVAFLLAGPKMKAVLATARAPQPAQPAAPSSGDTVTKRIDMAASGDPAAWLIRSDPKFFVDLESRSLPGDRSEPPQPPPRAGIQA